MGTGTTVFVNFSLLICNFKTQKYLLRDWKANVKSGKK